MASLYKTPTSLLRYSDGDPVWNHEVANSFIGYFALAQGITIKELVHS